MRIKVDISHQNRIKREINEAENMADYIKRELRNIKDDCPGFLAAKYNIGDQLERAYYNSCKIENDFDETKAEFNKFTNESETLIIRNHWSLLLNKFHYYNVQEMRFHQNNYVDVIEDFISVNNVESNSVVYNNAADDSNKHIEILNDTKASFVDNKKHNLVEKYPWLKKVPIFPVSMTALAMGMSNNLFEVKATDNINDTLLSTSKYLKSGVKVVSNIHSIQGKFNNYNKIARIGGNVAKKAEAGKWKAFLGWNDIMKSVGGASKATKVSTRFYNNFQKIKTQALKPKAGTIVTWALSGVINTFENIAEYNEGGISKERAVAETVLETALDVGVGIGTTVLVTAAIATAVGSAPVLAVAAGGILISSALNWGSKKLTGKDLTEAVSDGIIDSSMFVADKVGDASKAFGNAVSGAANKVMDAGEDIIKSAQNTMNNMVNCFKNPLGVFGTN